MENDENCDVGRSLIEGLAEVDRECIAYRWRIADAEQTLINDRESLAEWNKRRSDLIGQLALDEGISLPAQKPNPPQEAETAAAMDPLSAEKSLRSAVGAIIAKRGFDDATAILDGITPNGDAQDG